MHEHGLNVVLRTLKFNYSNGILNEKEIDIFHVAKK